MDIDRLWTSARDILTMPLVSFSDRPITLARIVGAVALLIALGWIARRVRHAVRRWAQQRSDATAHGDERAGAALGRIVDVVAWFVGLFLLLELFGIRMTSVMAVFAALGIGIGLGLQHLINNFVSGFILLFERPIRVGDLVELDGRIATVRRIGWRATQVVDWDNVETLIPNSRILESDLTNWTLSDSLARLNVRFGVHYRSDPEQVRRCALVIADAHPAIVADPPPLVALTAFGDSSLDFVLRVWTREPWRRNPIVSELLEALLQTFRQNGIEIPYPQRDVHVKGTVVAVIEGND